MTVSNIRLKTLRARRYEGLSDAEVLVKGTTILIRLFLGAALVGVLVALIATYGPALKSYLGSV